MTLIFKICYFGDFWTYRVRKPLKVELFQPSFLQN